MHKALVLGGNGMLGHKLWQALSKRMEVWVAIRSQPSSSARADFFRSARVLTGYDARDGASLRSTLDLVEPDVVVNAVGVVKQRVSEVGTIATIAVNALFPHQLENLCTQRGARLIHVSTDCVFSGAKGMYTEDDTPDPDDLYGRSKLLGEPNTGETTLTVRTSIIGRELSSSRGLVEWLLGNDGGHVRGYTRAKFSGFPSITLAGIIGDIIERHTHLSGLLNVAAEPITKFDLLVLIRDAYGLDIDIEPDPDLQIDRSLSAARFQAATGFKAESWEAMISQMAGDETAYDELRR